MSGFGSIGFDPPRLAAALILAATAMYLIAVAPGFRRRRALRRIAIALYLAVFAAIAAWVALWAAGLAGGR